MKKHTPDWNVIGHTWAVEHLAGRLASGRISHATLLSGIESSGKSLLALRLAQALECTGANPPCGTCRACELIERGQHPDVLMLQPEGAWLKIEPVRDLMAALTLRPVEARWRIGVLLSAEKMTGPAADALLKTLEEPPDTARLILTAISAESLPSTIASRCQVIALRPVPASEIEAGLVRRLNVPADQARLLARLAAGRPGWAVAAARDPEVLARRAAMLDGLMGALRSNRAGRLAFSEAAATRAEDLATMLDWWRSWWRDATLIAEGSPTEPVNADQWEILSGVAQAAGRDQCWVALKAVQRASALLAETNVNPRLALDVLLLKMPYL